MTVASAKLTKTKDGIRLQLSAIVTRGRNASAYLSRVILPKYQQAQMNRWESENTTQGQRWEPVSRPYQTLKTKKYASFPGGGQLLMIATGRLKEGAIHKDNSYSYDTVSDHGIQIAIDTGKLKYAIYPGARRPFMQFSDAQMKEWTDDLAQYVMRGTET